jgi:excisionase family DNA binding protein
MVRQTAAETLLSRQAAAVAAGGDRLLKVSEVARLLGVSSRQIFKLARSGQLPAAVKLSRSTRWRESDIRAFIANGCKLQPAAGQAVRA